MYERNTIDSISFWLTDASLDFGILSGFVASTGSDFICRVGLGRKFEYIVPTVNMQINKESRCYFINFNSVSLTLLVNGNELIAFPYNFVAHCTLFVKGTGCCSFSRKDVRDQPVVERVFIIVIQHVISSVHS